MLHMIIGVTAIVLGLWGVSRNWYVFVDVIRTVIPLGLIAFGIVAFIAGIRGMKKSGVEKGDK